VRKTKKGSSTPQGGIKKNLFLISHGAKLKIDIEDGRFIFFFAPVEW